MSATRSKVPSAVRAAIGCAVLGSVGLLAGCASMSAGGAAGSEVARLQPTQGNTATGEVRFTPQAGKLMVTAQLSGLKPNQAHGFHVHEKGDCSSPDATSAGGHFNPSGAPHGGPGAPRHAGDMPSLTADAQGRAQASFSIDGALTGDAARAFSGKAVVVHAMPDDYATQPTGNSGARIACGVIGQP